MSLSPIGSAVLALASVLSATGLALVVLRPRRTHDADDLAASADQWITPVPPGGIDGWVTAEQEAHPR